MHHDHTPRRFPWFKLALGGISILVLLGTFGGFMWLLRTYVDPPRIASAQPIRLSAADAVTPETSAEPRVILASRTIPPEIAMAARPEPERPAPRLPPPSSSVAERQAAPNTPPGRPAWPGAPSPGAPPWPTAADGPPASADAASFDGPVPLPRRKPRFVRVQLPANAPLPRPRPPA